MDCYIRVLRLKNTLEFTPDWLYYLGMSSEITEYPRLLKMNLPQRQSAFLWGARKVGKTTYLRHAFQSSVRYDLLASDLYFDFSKAPHHFREEVLQLSEEKLREPIIVDEVQKVPPLLDEVHWLIENRGLRFILCGSSARKLRRGHANLLGGRAWRFQMYPLTFLEVGGFDMLRAFNTGLIPSHYLSTDHKKTLASYVVDYLKEEVQAESLVRNIPAFARFLDAAAFSQGQLTNFSNISRDCGVDAKTIREYFEILVDTHLAYLIEPFVKKKSRRIISSLPKFYFFDVGVANALTKTSIAILKGEAAGRSFEHFILMELIAFRAYQEMDFDIRFWRTKSGLETDFVVGNGAVAIEVVLTDRVDAKDFRGLKTFVEEFAPKRAIVVSNEKRPRLIEISRYAAIEIYPWRVFLEKWWAKEILASPSG